MKRLTILLACAVVLSLGLSLVMADPQDAQSTAGASGQYSATAANAVIAEGGNVTNLNVSSDQSTQKWQGFWGNVSGSLRLGDGTSVFYDWSSVTFQAVFASPGNAVDWASVAAVTNVTTPDLEDKDTDFGFTSADADSIANTFSGDACAAGDQISAAAGVTPEGAGAWITCIGHDSSAAGVSQAVFGTNIASGLAYNGDTVDYQLMVPAESGNTNYFFYLEI